MTKEEELKQRRLEEDRHIAVMRELSEIKHFMQQAAATVIPDSLQLPPVFKDD